MDLFYSQKNKENRLLSSGDNVAVLSMLTKYAPLVKSRASYFLTSECELEDLIQEGNIGLLIASANYNSELSAFTTFARKCIDSAIIDYLRKTHKISSVPSELLVDISDIEVADSSQSLEHSVSLKDEYASLLKNADSVLSDFEHSVFSDMLCGLSFSEISQKHNCGIKSVHNAVQRIRAKLK